MNENFAGRVKVKLSFGGEESDSVVAVLVLLCALIFLLRLAVSAVWLIQALLPILLLFFNAHDSLLATFTRWLFLELLKYEYNGIYMLNLNLNNLVTTNNAFINF